MAKRRDFLAANKARRYATPGFVLQVRARDDASTARRVGFTVTKKIGGAVVRNRLKRRLRALARNLVANHGIAGTDYVFIGRADGLHRPYATMLTELQRALERAERA